MLKKRRIIISILLVLSIIILIIDSLSMEKRRNYYAKDIEFKNENQFIAIAYLENIYDSSKQYINNLNNIKIYELEGDQSYLVIPRYDKIEMNIYEISLEEDKIIKDNLLTSTNSPFIITGNNNILLEVKYNDITFEYQLKLNKNVINKNKYILDITK